VFFVFFFVKLESDFIWLVGCRFFWWLNGLFVDWLVDWLVGW